MKKVIVLSALLLAGCGMVTTGQAEKEERFTFADDNISTTQDTVTGCHYIIYKDWGSETSASITPLLDENGTPYCRKQ